jgi:deoxyribodipyrimidine photo-lyase
MNVVWIKRDARVVDHEPLSLAAAETLPCVVLYIYEPAHLSSAVYHESHHRFINEGLSELDAKLRAVAVGEDGGLTLRTGDAVDVLNALHRFLPIRKLFSHREVGNSISLLRNERVAAWTAANGIAWVQCRQDGVSDQRHAELDEGSWASKWSHHMMRPQLPPPSRLLFVGAHALPRGAIADAAACSVTHRGIRPSAQTGGEAAAHSILRSFLERRGEGYSEELSSPLSGWDSCSRISPCAALLPCAAARVLTASAGTYRGATYRCALCSRRFARGRRSCAARRNRAATPGAG